ncbi:MAG: hypothetical protein WBW04_19830 [Nitrolancea sp.]
MTTARERRQRRERDVTAQIEGRYALAKAIRRGMKEIPPELARFVSRDPFGA